MESIDDEELVKDHYNFANFASRARVRVIKTKSAEYARGYCDAMAEALSELTATGQLKEPFIPLYFQQSKPW